MQPNDAARNRHMIEAAEASQQFVEGKRRSDIDADRMLRFALQQAVEIIGEAASRITSETRSELNTVPWGAIISMRNRLIHAYFNIDHEILWKTVIEEIPRLLASLRAIPFKD